MIRVELVGKPNVSVEEQEYTISGNFSAYDQDNTVVASTTLSITGDVKETKAAIRDKQRASAKVWKDKIQVTEDFKSKIGVM